MKRRWAQRWLSQNQNKIFDTEELRDQRTNGESNFNTEELEKNEPREPEARELFEKTNLAISIT